MAFKDSLGREVPIDSSAIKTLLSTNVGKPTKFGQSKDKSEHYNEIESILSKIESFVGDLTSAQKYIKSILDGYKTSQNRKKESSNSGLTFAEKAQQAMFGFAKKTEKHNKISSDSIKKLAIHGLKRGSIYTHDIYAAAGMDELGKLQTTTNDLLSQIVSTSGNDGGMTPPPSNSSFAVPDPEEPLKIKWEIDDEALMKKKRVLANFLSGLSAAMLGGNDIFQYLFSGVIADEIIFMQGLRQIGFQTKGLTADSAELYTEWSRLGDGLEAVATTGQSLSKFQTQYLKNIKKGSKSLKETEKITKAGLGLGKLIGVDAMVTADAFASWNHSLDLSGTQLYGLSREIQHVALMSGVTGEELFEIVRSSEKFLKSMKNAGTYSAAAAGNIMRIRAEAHKLGVEDSTDKLLDAISTSVNFYSADQKVQTLLVQAAAASGRTQELINGTLTKTRDGMKEMAGGILQSFQNFSGLESFDDIKNLSADQLRDLNLRLDSAFGVQADEMRKIFQSMEKGSKGVGDRIGEINDQLNSANLNFETTKRLEKERTDIQLQSGLGFLTEFDNAITSKTKSITDAMGNMKISEDLQKDMKALGVDLADPLLSQEDKLKAVAKLTADKLKEAGGQDLTAQVQDAIDSGNIQNVKTAIDDLNEANQKLSIDDQAKLDPLSAAAFTLTKVNEAIRGYTTPALLALLGIAGTTGLILAQLMLNAASLALLHDIPKAIAGLKAAWTGFMEKGGIAGVLGGFFDKLKSKLPSLPGGALGKVGGILGKLALPIAAVTSAIGGLSQAFETGKKAAEIFNVTQDKVTSTQKMAAESAGLWTGMLNTLTFGIFDGLLGSTGYLTKALAKLMAIFPPLAWATQALLFPFKLLFSILKGLGDFLKNVFVGIWDAIKIVIEPFVEAFVEIKKAFSDALAPLFEAGEGLGSLPNLFELITWSIGGLGKAIAWVLKTLAKVIAFFTRFIIKPIVAGIKFIVETIKPFVSAIQTMASGIQDLFYGIFNLDAEMFLKGLYKIFKGLGKFLLEIFLYPFKLIWKVIKALFDPAKWRAFGEKVMETLKYAFEQLPTWIVEALKSFAATLPAIVRELIVGMMGGFTLNILQGLTGMAADIAEYLGLESLAAGLRSLSSVFGSVKDSLYQAYDAIVSTFGNIHSYIVGAMNSLWEGIKSVMPSWLQSWLGIKQEEPKQATPDASQSAPTPSVPNPNKDYYPQRKTGGPSIGEGLHYLHDNEYVLSPKQTAIADDLVKSIPSRFNQDTTFADTNVQGRTMVSPTNIGETTVQGRLQQDRMESGGSSSAKELSQLTIYSSEQLAALEAILSVLEDINNQKAPVGETGEKMAVNKNKKSSLSKANYGKWQYGNNSNSPSRQVISDGL